MQRQQSNEHRPGLSRLPSGEGQRGGSGRRTPTSRVGGTPSVSDTQLAVTAEEEEKKKKKQRRPKPTRLTERLKMRGIRRLSADTSCGVADPNSDAAFAARDAEARFGCGVDGGGGQRRRNTAAMLESAERRSWSEGEARRKLPRRGSLTDTACAVADSVAAAKFRVSQSFRRHSSTSAGGGVRRDRMIRISSPPRRSWNGADGRGDEETDGPGGENGKAIKASRTNSRGQVVRRSSEDKMYEKAEDADAHWDGYVDDKDIDALWDELDEKEEEIGHGGSNGPSCCAKCLCLASITMMFSGAMAMSYFVFDIGKPLTSSHPLKGDVTPTAAPTISAAPVVATEATGEEGGVLGVEGEVTAYSFVAEGDTESSGTLVREKRSQGDEPPTNGTAMNSTSQSLLGDFADGNANETDVAFIWHAAGGEGEEDTGINTAESATAYSSIRDTDEENQVVALLLSALEPLDDPILGFNLMDDLTTEGTPSAEALSWILAEDDTTAMAAALQSVIDAETDITSEEEDRAAEFVERWAMARIYLGLGGGGQTLSSEGSMSSSFSWRTAAGYQAGEGWALNDGWLSADHVCDWYGVTCHEENDVIDGARTGGRRVRELLLAENGLAGILPAELVLLGQIESVDLRGNGLEGELPRTAFADGKLSALRYLGLSDNEGLSGSVPEELGTTSQLEVLLLHNTALTGEMPPSVCDLRSVALADLWADCGGSPPEVICDCCTECFGGVEN